MSRESIRLPLRTYRGPMTADAVTEWFDEMLSDLARVFETNVHLAIDAGDLDADDADLDDVLAEAAQRTKEARAQVRREVAALLTRMAEDVRALLEGGKR